MQTTSTKAHVSALTVLAMAALGKLTGLVAVPPVNDIGDAIVQLGGALVAAGAAWMMTYLAPNRPKV